MKIEKCINCGATFQNAICHYCNTDYSFQMDLADKINETSDLKIKGYYKLLDVAFKSEDFQESLDYANRILEIEPENKKVWGIKIYSSLNLQTLEQFQSGSGMNLLKQLSNTTADYAYKILDLIFSTAVSAILCTDQLDLATIINTASACLDRGIKEKGEKAIFLYRAISNRDPKFLSQLRHKNKVFEIIKTRYLTKEEKKRVRKKDMGGYVLGILSIPLFSLGVLGVAGIILSLIRLKKNKNSKSDLVTHENKLAKQGIIFSIVGLVLAVAYYVISFLYEDLLTINL